jgi:MFS superfamily sulfate permease-like transporter
MRYGRFVHILMFLVLLLVLPVLGMWSWNTLAGLYAGPEMQYKHALAALILLGFIKWVFSRGVKRTGGIRTGQHKHA